MTHHSPTQDLIVTFGFFFIAAGLLLQMGLDTVFAWRVRRMFRKGGQQ